MHVAAAVELRDRLGGELISEITPGCCGVVWCSWWTVSQRKVILDQHLDIPEAGINKVPRQDRKAALPGSLLGGRSTTASSVEHLLQQLLRQRLRRHSANTCSGRPDERHVESPRQHEHSRAGGGISVAARDSCGSPSDRGNRARQRGANPPRYIEIGFC